MIDKIRYVYFIGIGGIGMSALARYFRHQGCRVVGYDKTETALTQSLVEEGISVHYEDKVVNVDPDFFTIDDEHLVVWTPAIPRDLQILNAFIQAGVPLRKRSEVLGMISKNRFTIAIAGTHGKTTTSSIVAHLLTDSGYGCSAFLGGIATNYNSNLLTGSNNVIVVEADEYDRSFLTLHPDIAIVTSADADHLDIYGSKEQLQESFGEFLKQVSTTGQKIIKKDLPFDATTYYHAAHDMARGQVPQSSSFAVATNIRVHAEEFYFDYLDEHGEIRDIILGIPGQHNVENAVAAIRVARNLGIDNERIKHALSNFKGVKRRFEYIYREDGFVYIDDYAHHPQELRALLHAVKALYPNRELTLVFQPHLYSRTQDFMDEFASTLSEVDQLILMPIYPARELPIPGVDSEVLLEKCQSRGKQLLDEQQVKHYISKEKPSLLVTAGAGNIDRLVQPLKEIYANA